jgi:hypothetical protein
MARAAIILDATEEPHIEAEVPQVPVSRIGD